MSDSAEEQRDFRQEFKDLTKGFKAILAQLGELSRQTSDVSPVSKVETAKSLFDEQTVRNLTDEYRSLVRKAGETVIAAHNADALEYRGLRELKAAQELGAYNEICVAPANLFALLIGGPCIELIDQHGTYREYEMLQGGWPPSYRPVKIEMKRKASQLADEWCGLVPPDPSQCLKYAQACKRFASIAAGPIRASAVNAFEQAKYAESLIGDNKPTDDRLYDVLAEAYSDCKEQIKELGNLPKRETWKKNLRIYRKATGQQKNKPRSGRHTESQSQSIVEADEI